MLRLKKGITLLRHQKNEEAKAYFAALTRTEKQPAEPWLYHGECCFRLGQMEETKASLHKALDLRPVPTMISDILTMTNWRMLCSHSYVNSGHAFSPDGSQLAYVSARQDTNNDGRIDQHDNGGIYIVNLSSGAERYIVSDAYRNQQPVFSPDGSKIAYLSARAAARPGETQQANAALYLLDLAAGRETRVLDETHRTKYFRFMPDGTTLLFCGWLGGEVTSGIYTLNLTTGAITELVSNRFECTFPSFSPDGSRLVFASWRKDTNADGVIDMHDRSSIILREIDGEETVLVNETWNNSFPVFSPDGNSIAYLSIRRDTDGNGVVDTHDNAGIYLLDIRRKKEYCVVDDGFFNKFHSFTPDGQRLVFVSNWDDQGKTTTDGFFENKGIYVTDINGRETYQIVSDKYYGARSPVISPAGDSVVYVSWRAGTNRGLFLANLDRLPSPQETHGYIDTNL
jgi:Tol biopolymer transport system component